MMDSSLSLIRFNVLNFFYTVMNSRPFFPTTTTLYKLVHSVITAENQPDEVMRERLKWIGEHTHEEIDMPLPIVELMVFRNLYGNLNREIEIGENNFYLIELYNILDQVTTEMTSFIVTIGKKYNFEMPSQMNQSSSTGNMFGFGKNDTTNIAS